MTNDIWLWCGILLPLVAGWILDSLFGDPLWLPHPVVGFGKSISFFEKRLNKGEWRRLKGAFMALGLVGVVFAATWVILALLSPYPVVKLCVEIIGVFFCLAGKTLTKEVRLVFEACNESIDIARRQISRIVGRDTGNLSFQEIKTAALETLAENLSDGVIAPMFWYMVLGLPGMLAYKMVNTLDSMVGYKNQRFKDFGFFAAKMDDVANYIPARLTSLLMVLSAGKPGLLRFVRRFGRCHASPNSGYPEAALAGILDCRFGGTHDYFGEAVYKPFIGIHEKILTDVDLKISVRICQCSEVMMLFIASAVTAGIALLWRLFI